jgi:hypothetical protein
MSIDKEYKPKKVKAALQMCIDKGYDIHGLRGHPLYTKWDSMKQRCYNPNAAKYPSYGARGISVSDEWRDSFVSFYDYMMALPNAMRPDYTIDRIDNEGDYEPGNVRWASRHTQQANQGISNKNKSGFRGVSYYARDNNWEVGIKVKGERAYLRRYNTIQEAAEARNNYIIKNGLWEYPIQMTYVA